MWSGRQYAGVSKRDQNPEAQTAELGAAGWERVFVDHGKSNRVTERPQCLVCLAPAGRLAG